MWQLQTPDWVCSRSPGYCSTEVWGSGVHFYPRSSSTGLHIHNVRCHQCISDSPLHTQCEWGQITGSFGKRGEVSGFTLPGKKWRTLLNIHFGSSMSKGVNSDSDLKSHIYKWRCYLIQPTRVVVWGPLEDTRVSEFWEIRTIAGTWFNKQGVPQPLLNSSLLVLRCFPFPSLIMTLGTLFLQKFMG